MVKWKEVNRAEKEELEARVSVELPWEAESEWVPPSAFASADARGPFRMELPSDGTIETKYSFYDLPISERTLAGLRDYPSMTKIQCMTIPHILAGKDVIAEAATGSGKTLCYLIPILEAMYLRDVWQKDSDTLHSLIITPTRELAMQIFDVLAAKFKLHSTVSAMAVFGGKKMQDEQSRLGSVGVLIGTPGRILSHLEESYSLSCDNLKFLVLDEADKLIELGFVETLEKILASLPPKETRQNLFFSATIRGAAAHTLSKKFCRAPALRAAQNKFQVVPAAHPAWVKQPEVCKKVIEAFEGHLNVKTNVNLQHQYAIVPFAEKVNYLFTLLTQEFRKKVIVFCTTIKQVRFLYETLTKRKTGARIVELNGRQDQDKRLGVFDEFNRRLRAITLITTDVVGRGIDFPAVDLVIQFDCPPDVQTYSHRAGRTARGLNNVGTSMLFVAPTESAVVEKISTYLAIEMTQIKPNLKVLKDTKPTLRTYCAQNADIKHLATRAFQSFVKAYALMKDKKVFNLQALLAVRGPLAASHGLIDTPSLPPDLLAFDDDDTDASDADDELDGGVVKSKTVKEKNKSKLERLKERIAAKKAQKEVPQQAVSAAVAPQVIIEDDSDEEAPKAKPSRRERRRAKMQELRQMTVAEITQEKNLAIVADDGEADREDDPQKDWRDSERVQRALKKQRVVIKADGKAKLKGAGPIKTDHKFFLDNSDEEAVDMNTFEGVVSLMQKEENTPQESRDERIQRLQARLQQQKRQAAEEKQSKRRRKEAAAPAANLEDQLLADLDV